MPITMLNGFGCMACNQLGATADYYINSTLRALRPVTVYRTPGGPVLREVPKGSIVGEVFSYIERNGDVWWQLKEGGYAKHGTGVYDAQLAEYSGAGKQAELLKAAQSGGGGEGFGLWMDKLLAIGGVGVIGYLAIAAFAPSLLKKITKPKSK